MSYSLTQKEIKIGINTCFVNGKKLILSSCKCYANGLFNEALFLSIVGFEELAKMEELKLLKITQYTDDNYMKNFYYKKFKNHEFKHEFMKNISNAKELLSNFYKPNKKNALGNFMIDYSERIFGDLESLKQRLIYVDIKDNKFINPSNELIKGKIAVYISMILDKLIKYYDDSINFPRKDLQECINYQELLIKDIMEYNQELNKKLKN